MGQPGDTWRRLADLVADRNDRRAARRFVTSRCDEGAEWRRQPRPEGGDDEVWIAPTLCDLVLSRWGPPGDKQGTGTDQPRDSQGTDTGPAGDKPEQRSVDAEPWRELVTQLRADLDAARSKAATLEVALDAERRAREDADRGRHAAQERLSDVRAAWWRWYALATSRGLVARLRGWLPEVPAELASDAPRLAAPKG